MKNCVRAKICTDAIFRGWTSHSSQHGFRSGKKKAHRFKHMGFGQGYQRGMLSGKNHADLTRCGGSLRTSYKRGANVRTTRRAYLVKFKGYKDLFWSTEVTPQLLKEWHDRQQPSLLKVRVPRLQVSDFQPCDRRSKQLQLLACRMAQHKLCPIISLLRKWQSFK